eukprot:gene7377-31073_t
MRTLALLIAVGIFLPALAIPSFEPRRESETFGPFVGNATLAPAGGKCSASNDCNSTSCKEGVCCIGGAYTAHCKKCSSKTGACDDGSCDYAYEYREGTCKRVLTKVEWILAGSLAGGLGLCLLISIFRCLATKSARSRHSASANNVGRWAQESQGREDGRALLPSPSAQVVQPDGVYE